MNASATPNTCAECEKLRAELAAAQAQSAAQRAEIARLRAALDVAERAAKRQAAPFRKKDQPQSDPKKPGRKSGEAHGQHQHRAPPEHIDEQLDVPLPNCCPHCGGRHIHETHVDHQYQTDIIRTPVQRQFDIHVGQCQGCGETIRSRHPLQTSDATGAAAAQLGPAAHAAIGMCNKQLGLSYGKIETFFQDFFGIDLSRGGACRSVLRTGRRCEAAYEQIRLDIRGSPLVGPDETGWRVAGQTAWLHAFVGQQSTCYDIGNRSGDIAEKLLGLDWMGNLVHDGLSIYDRFTQAAHQQCLQHLQRRCERLLETAVGMAARLPRQVLEVIELAYEIRRDWRNDEIGIADQAKLGRLLTLCLTDLASGRFQTEANVRLANHILDHHGDWFRFLIDPTLDATNYRAEQAMRPAVVNRKVWGGNRTWVGARAQAVICSVLRTLHQNTRNVMDWLTAALCSPKPLLLPFLGR